MPGKRPAWGGLASWTGAPVDADTANRQAALDASLHTWVNNLKHGSESHA
ncbi:hypothetical protein [Streptomyces sp. NBC_01445]|nr:hypothetical protein [Streptomyces sp. NBC_01445]WSE04689.1 hypothetical protein OG574_15780 [Streptomyces sp. NBC_01445]